MAPPPPRRREVASTPPVATLVLLCLLLLVVAGAAAPVSATTRCDPEEGTPELAQAVAQAVGKRAARLAAARSEAQNNASASVVVAADAPIVIPTYFHVVAAYAEDEMRQYYPEGGYGGDAILSRQMDVLNERYLPVGLSFRLDGVTRTYSKPKWAMSRGGSGDYREMVAALRVGDYGTLNMFVMDLAAGTVLGYGTLPSTNAFKRQSDSVALLWWTLPGGAQPPPPPTPPPEPPSPPTPRPKKHKKHHKKHGPSKKSKGRGKRTSEAAGVVGGAASNSNDTTAAPAATLGATTTCDPPAVYNLGMTAVHETAHWAGGLLHTFTGGCSEPNDTISDTPATAKPNYCCPTSPPRDSCPLMGQGPALFADYLDYTEDPCVNLFTALQIVRLVAVYGELRMGVPV